MNCIMPGRISVTAEVLGVGSDGTEPSVVFAVHRRGVYSAERTLLKRFLFNCGEGTQRLCGENGVKLNSLDAIFLTRLDVRSASGIPGLVFALGGVGAAQLRIHGPSGTRDRLSAMESFVRRKYPRIECLEVGTAPDDPAPHRRESEPAIPRHAWAVGEPQEDQHARILAVPVGGEARGQPPTRCYICDKCAPLKQPSPPTPAANLNANPTDSDDGPDRAWLRRFYLSKGLADTVAHMDAILRRYRGRMDELKAQLVAKYGTVDDREASSDASSSSSSSSDSDSDDEEATPFDRDAPLNREWLEAFYALHEPAKLARVDHVLRQFAGREEQLKSMLLSKYSSSDATASEQPPVKKQKTEAHDETAIGDGSSTVGIPEEECVRDEKATRGPDDAASASASVCYILQFRSPPFPVVWIVDCASSWQIDSLVSRFSPPLDCGHRPTLVIHFSPRSVTNDPRYQQWIGTINGSAHDAVQHLVFDGQALRATRGGVFSFAFPASARNFLRNQADDVLPSASRWENLEMLLASGADAPAERAHPPLQLKIVKRVGDQSARAHIAQAKLSFALNEKAEADYSQTGWKHVFDKKPNDDADDEGVEETADSVKPQRPNTTSLDRAATKRLTILGTGSAAPSKLRASTSMYLPLTAEAVDGALPGMLIDCGEGSYGQLERLFDTTAALDARLAGLQCIWISHHHADHQCGLLRVLDEYVRATQHSPTLELHVVAPQSVLDYANAWLPELPPRVRLSTCAAMNDASADVRTHLGGYLRDMRSVRVWHCHDAFGLVLHFHDGAKLVYSGDTKPCDQLVRAGLGASLLIHEATFDDSMENDADKKKHSTVGQALDVARRMRAQRVVLTHFSQRYPALPPPMATSASASAMEIHCAYDGFTIAL